jgi:hypothetical protein
MFPICPVRHNGMAVLWCQSLLGSFIMHEEKITFDTRCDCLPPLLALEPFSHLAVKSVIFHSCTMCHIEDKNNLIFSLRG